MAWRRWPTRRPPPPRSSTPPTWAARCVPRDCGTRDTTNQYSAVVRLCMVDAGENPNDRLCEGSTTTFIEDDVVAGEAHVLGFGQDSGSWTPCCECDSAVSTSESADLNEGKEFYLAAGDDTRTLAATRIIGKLTHYGVRATGNPPAATSSSPRSTARAPTASTRPPWRSRRFRSRVRIRTSALLRSGCTRRARATRTATRRGPAATTRTVKWRRTSSTAPSAASSPRRPSPTTSGAAAALIDASSTRRARRHGLAGDPASSGNDGGVSARARRRGYPTAPTPRRTVASVSERTAAHRNAARGCSRKGDRVERRTALLDACAEERGATRPSGTRRAVRP